MTLPVSLTQDTLPVSSSVLFGRYFIAGHRISHPASALVIIITTRGQDYTPRLHVEVVLIGVMREADCGMGILAHVVERVGMEIARDAVTPQDMIRYIIHRQAVAGYGMSGACSLFLPLPGNRRIGHLNSEWRLKKELVDTSL